LSAAGALEAAWEAVTVVAVDPLSLLPQALTPTATASATVARRRIRDISSKVPPGSRREVWITTT
jgi:hypothetical protein